MKKCIPFGRNKKIDRKSKDSTKKKFHRDEGGEMEIKDEKSDPASIMRQLTSDDNHKLYNILLKIKQSLSTSVVQLFSAIMSEDTFQWESTVTGVACLTKTDESVYVIEV